MPTDHTAATVPPALAQAITDLLWRATPYGHTLDGDTAFYILSKGTVHRLIGAAQGCGIPAAFAAHPPSPDVEDECAECGHRATKHDGRVNRCYDCPDTDEHRFVMACGVRL
jgi:hypothetical protein